MPASSFPYPIHAALVERVEAAPPGRAAHRWVLRDDNQQHYHGVLPLNEDPAILELLWKVDARGREQRVGIFRLHLAALVAGGYARMEPQGAERKLVRVRFHRGGRGVVYLQARADLPALAVGTVDQTV